MLMKRKQTEKDTNLKWELPLVGITGAKWGWLAMHLQLHPISLIFWTTKLTSVPEDTHFRLLKITTLKH